MFNESDYERAAWLEDAERRAGIEAARRPPTEKPRERNGVRVCLDCDEPIDPRRLISQPRAVRCTDCQEYHDVKERQGG
jgi:RNA polymerase-binding transcription factor DksA